MNKPCDSGPVRLNCDLFGSLDVNGLKSLWSALDIKADRVYNAIGALQRIRDAAGASLILILSDINMPGMTGLELLPKAKALRPDVPVIMITAYADNQTKRKALEGGAEALLTKPIDFAALRSEIDTRMERAA